MFSIKKTSIPRNTLLGTYQTTGAYVDCYSTNVPGSISLAEFIYAFYTTFLFQLERFILRWIVSKPSMDSEARQLADGHLESFAAWHMESRSENELLMCDFRGRTRSWLMVVPEGTLGEPRTRLYFGSAVVPARSKRSGKPSLGAISQALLGFHKVYSVLLLYSAKLNIIRPPGS